MKKTFGTHLGVGALLLGLSACGGDSTGVSAKLPVALVGTWVANPACSPDCGYVLTSTSNPAASADLVANGVTTVTLQLHTDGGATLNLLGFSEAGSARVDGNVLYLTTGATTDTVDYSVTPTTLDLHIRTQVAVLDFNNDGVADPATQHAILTKQ